MNERITATVLLLLLLCHVFYLSHVSGKECTNTPTELSSHTFRYDILNSENETLKEEIFAHYHLTPTDESAWSNLLPRRILKQGEEYPWLMMYRRIKKNFGEPGKFLKEISLHNVRLNPKSLHGQAQQTNLEYLLMLDVDSLVWSFRKTASLPTPGQPYGGWEDPTRELRGHFVGHYLSASALMWASTHNETLKKKMSEVVSALSECQISIGSGYLSAFPSEQFDRFEEIKPVWAPYYTIHKIMAGLLDQYALASNDDGLKMVNWMVDYFFNRVQNVINKYSIERHWKSLNEETGGMNDVLYRLYTITGNETHLLLAHLFDKPCFLGSLAVKADELSGFHANTHIPIVIGSQMRYEVTGDPLYKEIGTFFMDIVNSSHTYATGGTSVSEFWSDPKRLAGTLQTENEESCTTYNMLKVSRNLFRWTKELAYADYYERALANGVMGIQRGREPGVMIYMLPLGRGISKARSYHGWGNKFDSFWCCYGTGIESFSKLGDSIYFEDEGGLYIVQYIPSSVNWESGQINVTQNVQSLVSFDPRLQVTLTISPNVGAGKVESESTKLNLRIPSWTNYKDAKASLNDQNLSLPNPGNFLSVTKNWSSGDRIVLELPFGLRTEAIKDDRQEFSFLQAILYGPYLLAGLTISSDWDWDIKMGKSFSNWITPVPANYNSQLITLSQESRNTTFVLMNTNSSISFNPIPLPGTDAAIHSTFRIITNSEISSPQDAIGKEVMLEPFDFPGKLVATEAKAGLVVADNGTMFHLVKGLDGKEKTVSLESNNQRGCFVFRTGLTVGLKCKSNRNSVDEEFEEAASFKMEGGIAEYDPVSFIVNGVNRNFVLSPLFSLRDESYTVYFNIQS
ncbi:uncharacterized protein LOC124923875 [Impatiens glandulifera]|uniref:uncharacterized protein LOC124923875 n=1 Tax=Impatiens glandulifera TaxID=253017 RepID=UPI001FB06C12|nr:uncharacterized protein LOC124923875 [Impatiens glandulifera]